MNWSTQGFSLVLSFILASLLGPENFGVLAMALVVVEFMYQLLEQGIGPTLVQRRDLQAKHTNSVFWIMFIGGIILWGCTATLSTWWAEVNGVPRLASVLFGLAAVIPLKGLTVVPQAMLQRAMAFRALAVRSIISVMAGGAVGVVMALSGFGVWALVGQQFVTALVSGAMTWILARWVPAIEFSVKAVLEITRFSLAVFLGNIGTLVSNRVDVLIIGLFFGPLAVGLYRLAHRLVSVVSELTMRPFHMVTLPHLSQSMETMEHRREIVAGCVRASSAICIPAMGALASIAAPLLTLLGPEWQPAIGALRVLCVFGIIKAITVFIGPGLIAAGRVMGFAGYSWLLAIGSAIALAVAGCWLKGSEVEVQAAGLAAARVVGIGLVSISLALYILPSLGGLSIMALLRLVVPGLLAGVFTFIAGLGVASVLNNLHMPNLVWLGLTSCITGIIYGLSVLLLYPELRLSLGRNLTSFCKSPYAWLSGMFS